jgi:alpha-beta hydrolase superfamily lysophospholipase
MVTELPPLDSGVLLPGISARFVENVNGLRMHVLEAGTPGRPCLLLLHGFPELAYSWRKVMGPLAAAGFHVVAPDQRGYGRTTGWDRSYDGDVASFRLFNLVRDALGLLAALGYRSVAAVIGHDFGSPVAAWWRRQGKTSTPRSPSSTGRASIINGTIRRARRTPTCTTARKASTISCAPTSITRAPTGGQTNPTRSNL